MCVIAYKAKNVRFPSDSNIEDMWENNSDGAGIMWRREDGLIQYEKGFMKLKALKEWIAKNREWLEEVECALHFRITTHGGTSQGNCHPFVIGDDDSHSLWGIAKRILMHNGILGIKPRKSDISDSAELALRISEYVNPIDPLITLNEQLSGNRIIVMDENGTHFFGDDFKKSTEKGNEGILYSNLNHECSTKGFLGFGKRVSEEVGTMWDDIKGTFVDIASKREIPISRVDPNDLSYDDYEIWEALYYEDMEVDDICSKYGLTRDDYSNMEAEAEALGMDTEEYIMKFFDMDDEPVRACS